MLKYTIIQTEYKSSKSKRPTPKKLLQIIENYKNSRYLQGLREISVQLIGLLEIYRFSQNILDKFRFLLQFQYIIFLTYN